MLVESCRECNDLLGATEIPTSIERLEAIKKILSKRYARLLALPAWTAEELNQLGDTLRGHIGPSSDVKKWIERRLDWSVDDYIRAIPVDI